MSATLAPKSVEELLEIVRASPRLLAVGAGTKSRLSQVNATKVSALQLRGIVEYEPSEFTFTAMAGTTLREIIETLSKSGQYLPFDPLLVDAGATLGGTVAAGVSGPGRLRFGGIRDFILGVHFVNGLGKALRVGGKVVKNAAGFDVPKFLVGSLGRFGVLAELTFKVFPAPASTITLKLNARDIEAAVRIVVEAAGSRWEAHALDILPVKCEVCVRLGGPAQALKEIAKDILARWPGEQLSAAEAQRVWLDLRELRWAHAQGPLIKVALTPSVVPALHRGLQPFEDARIHVSSGGNVAFVSLSTPEQTSALSELLRRLSLAGVTMRGEGPLWCGLQTRPKIVEAVKQVLDPGNRFPGLDE
jgi:glycolate oxidase FAD binding subunit